MAHYIVSTITSGMGAGRFFHPTTKVRCACGFVEGALTQDIATARVLNHIENNASK